MSDADDEVPENESEAPLRRRYPRRLLVLGLLFSVMALVLAALWFQRVSLADRIIAGQLKDLGLPATYTIESIGARRQILTDIVVGNPARPDLTVERAIVEIRPTFGLPTVKAVTLLKPRLYGTIKDARASFGSLDAILFRETAEPAGIPDMNLRLQDGRARLETDFGVIGVKAEGAGNLRDGFTGYAAAIARSLSFAGCTADHATAYGAIRVVNAKPRFSGPLRLADLRCADQGLQLRRAGLRLDLMTSEQFDSASGSYGLASGTLSATGMKAGQLRGKGDFTFVKGGLTARYAMEMETLSSGYAKAGNLSVEGIVRSADGFSRIESEGALSVNGLGPGEDLMLALASARKSGEGTLIAPVAAQIGAVLAREGSGSHLSMEYTWRQTGGRAAVVVPRANLRGGSGANLFTLSRFQLGASRNGELEFSGNVVTGGAGLPRLEGQIERQDGGVMLARFSMPEYRAGSTRIALPRLAIVQRPGAELNFSGLARVSGDLPGGQVEGLDIPLDGTWSQRHGLSAWRRCAPIRFDRFLIAGLSLEKREVMLCPGREGAIVRNDRAGLRIAVGAPSLNLAGHLGTTPIRLKSGAVGFAWPGHLAARSIDVSLGPVSEPTTLTVADLKARLGAVTAGTFSGAAFKLAAVPLDVLDAQGDWQFGNGDLSLSGASFRVEDRQLDDRFRPLLARDATLSLHSTQFVAEAVLREPKSDREILQAHIVHDLDTANGYADLSAPAIVFDDKLQPDTLTVLALGIIANAQGTVTGRGRIDWQGDTVTSSGSVHTDGLDFAAAFGPVKGTSGTVIFTDLLGLVTAPDQRLKIASINPGIEATDGVMSFQLQPNDVLIVNGATWPFLDGQLKLKPARMVLGASEVRRYTLQVTGIEAARFIERLELSNISASGLFDGTLPLIFDENGGRIEGGMLVSRPPGGNVSYVGELTYKDLGAMANFAFQSLRSLDYKRMQIAMDGQLEGDIVTRVRFDGVHQGAAAKRNFVTRQFDKLPIQFNLNIRAPFQKLVGSFKSLYDPGSVRDPRELGLVGKDGKAVAPASPAPEPQTTQGIQPSDSRNRP